MGEAEKLLRTDSLAQANQVNDSAAIML